MNNANNGLITKIWGPSMWMSFHSIAFGYPNEPTDEQKTWYKSFYENLGNVLPCKYCRISYQQFILESDTLLDDSVFENRKTLTKWTYLIHQKVNKKLGVNYSIDYDDIVSRYEAYRAKCMPQDDKFKPPGCTVPLDYKAKSYDVAENKDCPVIPTELALKFAKYAQLRGIKNFIETVNANLNYESTKGTDIWITRNKKCCDIVSRMKKQSINSIEETGIYKGLPTIDELNLIAIRSSYLSQTELEEIAKKLTYLNNLNTTKYILKKVD